MVHVGVLNHPPCPTNPSPLCLWLNQELQDYFYYTQLRIQGEDTTNARQADGLIPVSEVGLMMRALGFFPTEMEIDNMVGDALVDGV